MKRALISFLGFILWLPLSTVAEEKHPTPTIDVEIVWTDVLNNKTDLFVLVTNPNDFDVYLGQCGGSTTQRPDSRTYACGSICTNQEDFTRLAAKTKRLSQFWRGCDLKPGPNPFTITINSALDPKAKLPWNYIVIGSRSFSFVIDNDDHPKE